MKIDGAVSKSILVEENDKKWITFEKNDLGLFVHNVRDGSIGFRNSAEHKNTVKRYSLFQTVADNESNFTAGEARASKEASKLSRRSGCPALRTFSKSLNNG